MSLTMYTDISNLPQDTQAPGDMAGSGESKLGNDKVNVIKNRGHSSIHCTCIACVWLCNTKSWVSYSYNWKQFAYGIYARDL